MFQNKKCVIIGSGASIRQGDWNTQCKDLQLWNSLKNCFTIGINWSFHYIPSTIHVFVDPHFWKSEQDHLNNIPLIISAQDSEYGKVFKRDYRTFNRVDSNFWLLPPSNVYNGKDSWVEGFYTRRLSGLFSTTLAISLGFKEIYLLGQDNGSIDGKTHFYQDDESIGKIFIKETKKIKTGVGFNDRGHYNTSHYQNEDIDKWWKPYLKEDVKIYNVSINSKISVFQKIPYSVFYKMIENETINQQKSRKYIKGLLKKYYA